MVVSPHRQPCKPLVDAAPSPLRIFYRQNGILVTSREFSASGRHYEITDLTDVTRYWESRRRMGLLGITIMAAAEVFILALVSLVEVPFAWLLLAAVPMISLVIWACFVRSRLPRLDLVGRYHGCPVLLLSTRDDVVFGQVGRALQRAMESARGDR